MAGENNVGPVLLDFWVSPFGQRYRIVLAEKGLPYEYAEENIMIIKSATVSSAQSDLQTDPVHLHDEVFPRVPR